MIIKLKTANDLNLGETSIIKKLNGPKEVTSRLRELGFIVGAEVTCLQKMPFDGPKIFQVSSITVALRSQESECLEI